MPQARAQQGNRPWFTPRKLDFARSPIIRRAVNTAVNKAISYLTPRRGAHRVRLRRSNAPSRIGSTYKVKKRRLRLKKLGVTDFVPRYMLNEATDRIVLSTSSKQIGYLESINTGFFGKTMLDSIYTNETLDNDADEIVLTNQRVEYVLKNQSDMAIYMTLTENKLKRHWTTTFGTSGALITDAFASIGLAASNEQQLCANLEMCPKWKHWVKTIRKKTFILQPGETRKVIFSNPRIKKMNFMYKSEADISVLAGTHFFTYEAHGVPTHDSTTATNIGLSASVVDVYMSRKYTYRELDSNTHPKAFESTAVNDPAVPVGFVDEDLAESAIEV